MDSPDSPHTVAGKTVRFTWKDGPTEGKVHEHVFDTEGTVQWHEAGGERSGERARFHEEGVADGIRLVSYLAGSGYALTVVLNFNSKLIAGIASGNGAWVPVHGSFEVVTPA